MTDNFRKLSIVGIIAVMALATTFSFVVTGSGLAVEGDGYYFINAARIIAAHMGIGEQAAVDRALLREITAYYAYTVGWWPPVYPAMLAAVSFSTDPYTAGRWLHLAFPFIIGSLLWLTVYRNQKDHTRALPTIALVLLSPEILRLNWYIYSEILFIVMQSAVLLTFSYYLWTRRKFWLVMTVVLIGISGLTRYVGVVMALALCITLWKMNHAHPFSRKTAATIACFAFIVLPVALFLLFSIISSGEPAVASRTIAWGWPVSKMWWFFNKSLYSPLVYLTPAWWTQNPRIIFFVFALVAIAIIYVFQTKRQRQQQPAEAVLQLQLFIKLCLLIYVVLVALLALFLDHMLSFTGITPRHFAPIFVWGVILLVLIRPMNTPDKSGCADRFMSVFASIFTVLLILIFLAGSAANAFKNNNIAAEENRFWKNALTLAQTQKNEATPWIATNMPYEVFHYLRAPVFALPSRYDFSKDQINNNYQKQMAQLRRILHQYNGMVIFFYKPAGMTAYHTPGLSECLRELGLEVSVTGTIYAILRPFPQTPEVNKKRKENKHEASSYPTGQ